MNYKYILSKIPRKNGAHVYNVKSNIKFYPNIIHLYDAMSQEYCDTMHAHFMISLISLRYGDIIIDKSIQGTIGYIGGMKVPRNGILIFNGIQLQYLDRTLNGSGTIPSNFPSFTIFKLGYWGKIFNDNIIWIEPINKFTVVGNMIKTEYYNILTTDESIRVLVELLNGSENIITHIPDMKIPVLHFDIELHESYKKRKNLKN